METTHRYVARCPKGVEDLLRDELDGLGAQDIRQTRAAVTFAGDMEVAYRACLWSRLASRVLMELSAFDCVTDADLYAGVSAVAWEEHLSADSTLAVNAVGRTSALTHTGFVARRVKDAVVDRIREAVGERPSVDLERPDIRLDLRLHNGRATLSLDLSGDPLHRRGYRLPGEQVAAPLKENLAAAILIRAGWPEIARAGGALCDPMCGSGTLLIEGAYIAADRAPGLLRDRWGFLGWMGHEPEVWDRLLAEADDRAESGDSAMPLISGWDIDPSAVEIARGCVRRAGLGDRVQIGIGPVDDLVPHAAAKAGLLVTNPPYGVRLGETATLSILYALLGKRLAEGFDGWRAAIFTAEADLARATGLRSSKAYTLYNGAVETKLYLFEVDPTNIKREVKRVPDAVAPQAEMFANRVRKRYRHLRKWARREDVTCFRVYDADLPEYAVAVDLYQGAGPDEGRRFAHVQEYAPPRSIDVDKAQARLDAIMKAVPSLLDVPPEDVFLKVRRRQQGDEQYERQAARGGFVRIAEGGLMFLVNPTDYLDTGIFLDHRPVRTLLRSMSEGVRFLNLFGYTGTASVYAAAGGARTVTTVDMSSTYLRWAERNMELDGFGANPSRQYLREDVLSWLGEERKRVLRGDVEPYDLVFLDPPTFSNSKRMGDRHLDIQRDHVWLLRETVDLLSDSGTIVFSSNFRKFRLDAENLQDLDIEDITAATIPPDFERSPRIHSCFTVKRYTG